MEADPAVRQVVVTNVPPVEGQMRRAPGGPNGGFASAYFGNLTLGVMARRRRKVAHTVSGHTHVGRE